MRRHALERPLPAELGDDIIAEIDRDERQAARAFPDCCEHAQRGHVPGDEAAVEIVVPSKKPAIGGARVLDPPEALTHQGYVGTLGVHPLAKSDLAFVGDKEFCLVVENADDAFIRGVRGNELGGDRAETKIVGRGDGEVVEAGTKTRRRVVEEHEFLAGLADGPVRLEHAGRSDWQADDSVGRSGRETQKLRFCLSLSNPQSTISDTVAPYCPSVAMIPASS